MMSLFLSTLAHADQKIAMKDVASAFTWIKIAPELPLVITAESEDQIAFRFFDDAYTITREKHEFKISKSTYTSGSGKMETEFLDEVLVEKILKFVRAKRRAAAILSEDTFQQSIKTRKIPEGYQESKTVYQCSSDLPSRIMQNGSPVNQILQHTWIQNGAMESFGMPNTDESTYFGGRAHIRSPDSFIARGPKHLECSPVWIESQENEKKISERIACVSRAISLPQNPVFEGDLSQDWVAHFDYHALERNCLVATRFALECAGAKASQVVNAGIGGKLDWTDTYSYSEVSPTLKLQVMELRAQLDLLRKESSIADTSKRAQALIGMAIELDARIRGVGEPSKPANLREICNLALAKCS